MQKNFSVLRVFKNEGNDPADPTQTQDDEDDSWGFGKKI